MSGLTGRFLSRDPIGYRGGVNLYRFLQTSPMMRLDPTGHVPIDCTCNCYKPRCRDIEGYDETFTVTTNCVSNASVCCGQVCRDEGQSRGIPWSSSNCRMKSWQVTGALPDEPIYPEHCSIPDCKLGCALVAKGVFTLCLAKGGGPQVCYTVAAAAGFACERSCEVRCDDPNSWIYPEIWHWWETWPVVDHGGSTIG